jgi:hypothetical protein
VRQTKARDGLCMCLMWRLQPGGLVEHSVWRKQGATDKQETRVASAAATCLSLADPRLTRSSPRAGRVGLRIERESGEYLLSIV